ncbi:uncharacterized protein LOC119596714 [Penaeus monodon]|uniref:uncharacterized protein LOC119596714 n=1 Tax=Penaeus monodon TaxID=6687 RepID=UPI0018A70B11|nr:uncharacterized protein LOC119596714 [Penaeus monodon]
MFMEKYKEGQRQLDCVFIDLEKAYDRVPRKELWHCMRESSIPEVYARVVQDMYNECMTAVRSVVGITEGFKVEAGKLTDGLWKGAPWTMTFADDIVLCSENRGEPEKDRERWRHALERRGMKTVKVLSNAAVKRSVQARWSGWRKVTGVLCDRNMPIGVKGKIYRTCVRPALLYDMETIPVTKLQEVKMEVAEMRILRFTLGLTRKNRIRNETC